MLSLKTRYLPCNAEQLKTFHKGGFIAGLLDYLKLGACVCYMLYNHFIFL